MISLNMPMEMNVGTFLAMCAFALVTGAAIGFAVALKIRMELN